MFTLPSIRQQPIKPKKDLFDSIYLDWFLLGNLSLKGIVGQMIVKRIYLIQFTLTGSCSAISASKELWVK